MSKLLFVHSTLWRQENTLQQQLSSTTEELNKRLQGLRSLTGKVLIIREVGGKGGCVWWWGVGNGKGEHHCIDEIKSLHVVL